MFFVVVFVHNSRICFLFQVERFKVLDHHHHCNDNKINLSLSLTLWLLGNVFSFWKDLHHTERESIDDDDDDDVQVQVQVINYLELLIQQQQQQQKNVMVLRKDG